MNEFWQTVVIAVLVVVSAVYVARRLLPVWRNKGRAKAGCSSCGTSDSAKKNREKA